MNKKTMLVSVIAGLAVVGVVVALIATRQQTPPSEPASGSSPEVSSVDTSDWFPYTNTRFNYSVLIPSGFENQAVYENTKLDFDPLASGINAVKGDKVINVTSESGALFEGEGELSERLLRRVKDGSSKLFDADGNIFVENLTPQNGSSFATTTQDTVLTLTFRNVAEPVMRAVLKSFKLGTGNWQTYRNEGLGFEIKYPPTWRYIENLPHANVGFRDAEVVPADLNWVSVWIDVRDIRQGEDLSKREYGEDEGLVKTKQGEKFTINNDISGYYFHSIPGVVSLDVIVFTQGNKVYEISKINNQGEVVDKIFDRMTHEIRFIQQA